MINNELFVIYKGKKKLETTSNGYNTKQGAKAALTMLVKKEHPENWGEKRKELYSIKEFIPKEDLTFINALRYKMRGDC